MKKLFLYIFMFFLSSSIFPAEWTLIVYIDGDNNLEAMGINDINEMEEIGSTNDVNVVVLFDRVPGYTNSNGDWTDTRRGLIIKDTNTDVISSNLVSVGEKNMGDPATLSEFANWAITNYPANNYALILWDHGNGWMKKNSKNDGKIADEIVKEVCRDESNNNDALKPKEIRQALETLPVKINILAFDACLMGMMEVAYETRNNAQIFIGSESTIPADGYPYNTIIQYLVSNPAASPASLSETIVTKYAESYYNEQTLAAIDPQKIGQLNQSLKSFAERAVLQNNLWLELNEARSKTQYFESYQAYDIKDFLINIYNLTSDDYLADYAALSLKAQEECVIKNHSSALLKSNGLSIYLPGIGVQFSKDYNANNLQFASDNLWDEMLYIWTSQIIPDDVFEENDTESFAAKVAPGIYPGLQCFDKDWYDITIDKKGEYLFLADHISETGDMDVNFYGRNPSDNSLSLIQTLDTVRNTEGLMYDVQTTGVFTMEVIPSLRLNSYALQITENKIGPDFNLQEIPYQWFDISSLGTSVPIQDDSNANIKIGFPFEYLGSVYNYINLSSNGYLTFDDDNADLYLNQAFPADVPPRSVIALFWDDLTPAADSSLFYYLDESDSENPRLIIQWDNIGHYKYYQSVSTGRLFFQAVIYKNGDIDFVYNDVFFDNGDERNYGAKASAGLSDYTGTKGYMLCFNQPKLKNNTTYRWTFDKQSGAEEIVFNDFETNADNWLSYSPAGFNPPGFANSPDYLIISPSGTNNFGFWTSPEDLIPSADSSYIYAVSANIKTDFEQCKSPSLRIRTNSSDFSESYIKVTNSIGDCAFSPNDKPSESILYFQPLQSAENKNFSASIDILNLDTADANSGNIFIDSVSVSRLKKDSLLQKQKVKKYTFVFSNEAWVNAGKIGKYTEPQYEYTSGTLKMYNSGKNTFGFWMNSPDDFETNPNKIYRAEFKIQTSEILTTGTASVRTRLFSEDNQIISSGEIRLTPIIESRKNPVSDFEPQRKIQNAQIHNNEKNTASSPEYIISVYFVMHSIPSSVSLNGLGIAFDIINESDFTKTDFAVMLDEVLVESYNIPVF